MTNYGRQPYTRTIVLFAVGADILGHVLAEPRPTGPCYATCSGPMLFGTDVVAP